MRKREKKAHPVVSAVVEAGAAWTSAGPDADKLSLENSAGALTRAARAVETRARNDDKRRPTPKE